MLALVLLPLLIAADDMLRNEKNNNRHRTALPRAARAYAIMSARAIYSIITICLRHGVANVLPWRVAMLLRCLLMLMRARAIVEIVTCYDV